MRIGIDLGGTKIEGILLSDIGDVVEKIRVETPGGNYLETIEALCDLVEQLQNKSGPENCSVGIGTPAPYPLPTKTMLNL